eukprot:CAMPEP_0119377940 /NCGR_PEP_ID=MMETSP1334-20130426/47304_1 /TAXON_ID=127549 /ORGANISM="Calcidiscus leptoporus, Strain RCC1130" /LENGTH=80 /DNA_ID=CAMNT_0007397015 /DNA_START=1451 /DNA_END=1693 /DNA_ORIENTATION=+
MAVSVEVGRCPSPDDGLVAFLLPWHVRRVGRPDVSEVAVVGQRKEGAVALRKQPHLDYHGHAEGVPLQAQRGVAKLHKEA